MSFITKIFVINSVVYETKFDDNELNLIFAVEIPLNMETRTWKEKNRFFSFFWQCSIFPPTWKSNVTIIDFCEKSRKKDENLWDSWWNWWNLWEKCEEDDWKKFKVVIFEFKPPKFDKFESFTTNFPLQVFHNFIAIFQVPIAIFQNSSHYSMM